MHVFISLLRRQVVRVDDCEHARQAPLFFLKRAQFRDSLLHEGEALSALRDHIHWLIAGRHFCNRTHWTSRRRGLFIEHRLLFRQQHSRRLVNNLVRRRHASATVRGGAPMDPFARRRNAVDIAARWARIAVIVRLEARHLGVALYAIPDRDSVGLRMYVRVAGRANH